MRTIGSKKSAISSATMNRKSTCFTAPATTQRKSRSSGRPTSWIHRGIKIFGTERSYAALRPFGRLRYGAPDGLLPPHRAPSARAPTPERAFETRRTHGGALRRLYRDLHRPARRRVQLRRTDLPAIASEVDPCEPEQPAAGDGDRDAGAAPHPVADLAGRRHRARLPRDRRQLAAADAGRP